MKKTRIVFIVLALTVCYYVAHNIYIDRKLFRNTHQTEEGTKTVVEESFRKFDISADDKQIIFTYEKDSVSTIYVMNSDGSDLKKITSSKDYFLENPKYSKDGKQFIYLSFKRGTLNSSINRCNIDGSSNEKLTADDNIITEATYSRDGESILYCKANEYASYSPLGHKAPHDMDIYSISLKDKKIKRLSNLKSYEITSISDFDDNYILMRDINGKNDGMGFLSKNNGIGFERLVPANDPRKLADIYGDPIYTQRFKILVFTAPNEIFIMNLQDKIAKSVFLNKGGVHIYHVSIFNNEQKILFSLRDDRALYEVNFDGTDLHTIPFNID